MCCFIAVFIHFIPCFLQCNENKTTKVVPCFSTIRQASKSMDWARFRSHINTIISESNMCKSFPHGGFPSIFRESVELEFSDNIAKPNDFWSLIFHPTNTLLDAYVMLCRLVENIYQIDVKLPNNAHWIAYAIRGKNNNQNKNIWALFNVWNALWSWWTFFRVLLVLYSICYCICRLFVMSFRVHISLTFFSQRAI